MEFYIQTRGYNNLSLYYASNIDDESIEKMDSLVPTLI
jgi:hypothetical protein